MFTHPADVPSVAPMGVQLDAARALRAASFFDQARAARDDIAYGAYPSLGREPLTAPMFRDGVEVASAVVNIIGVYARGTYIVQDVRSGEQWIAFTGEIHADYGENCEHLTPNPWSLCCA